MNSLCVVGLGYIGLPTAIIAAEAGYDVVGVDIDEAIVRQVNGSQMHFHEPFLGDLLASEVARGRLRAQVAPEPADVFVIAVPTPFGQGYEPDVSAVEAASRAVAPHLKPGDTVIIESTVPVGTTAHIRDLLAASRSDLDFARHDDTPGGDGGSHDVAVAFCPERVLPGRIAQELRSNDRIIGGLTPRCAVQAARFYAAFVDGECHLTSAPVAELVKLSENAFRDVNIAFANEISMISGRFGLDPWEVIALANRHPRVGILSPGPGVGGHCIAVDPWFVVHSAPEEAQLIRQARQVNLRKTDWVVERAAAMIEDRQARTVALLGLSYKADADDFRESPAVDVADRLLRARPHTRFLLVEPNMQVVPDRLAGATLASIDDALADADFVVCLAAHSAFKPHAAELARRPHLDTVGLLRD